jgi:hypothetical protein
MNRVVVHGRDPGANPELKNKSMVRPRNAAQNSFNTAVAKEDRTDPGKSTLNFKSTGTIEIRRNNQ